MLARHITPAVLKAASAYPVVTLTGARQSGKTTLVRSLFPDHTYLSLESPDNRAQALTDPRGFLARGRQLILDEIQRAPDLLSYLQEIVDQDKVSGRFILTGSHNLFLMKAVSQTLAGRTAVLVLHPFSIAEIHATKAIDPVQLDQVDASAFESHPANLWDSLVKGFYPYIHDRQVDAYDWYGDYFRTYVERDLREVTQVSNLPRFENFVRLAAAHTGRELNLSALANDLGITQQTARRWMDALELGYITFPLPPHFANFRKRLRNRPRLHFLDSGLVCYLLGIRDAATLQQHPLRGHIFESFVVSELVKHFCATQRDVPLYHWRDATGHEIDVLIDCGQRLLPVEVKSGSTLASDACNTLLWWSRLPGNPNQSGVLIHGGDRSFDLQGIRVLPWFLGQ